MFRSPFLVIVFTFPVIALAADLQLSDLRAKNAVQLSADELKQLMPNALVESIHPNGSARRWRNEPSGKFLATSDVRGKGKKVAHAQGTWRISDDGKYCVELEWPRATESWCKYVFRLDGKYYGVNTVTDPSARVMEFEFSK